MTSPGPASMMMAKPKDLRVAALTRFAVSITGFSLVGRAFLGFEQSWLQWLVSLLAAYAFELIFETLYALAEGRRASYLGGPLAFVTFLLPAHIAGTAIALLLYPGDRYGLFIFANAVAVGSKYVFRVPVNGRSRHFVNPSNFAISFVLLFFTWVGPAPPYHFTETIGGAWDWVVPVILLASGVLLNVQLTKKWPLMIGWVGGFLAQALIRALFFGDQFSAILSVALGTAFILFTCYMITDPGTTPFKPWRQVAFGVSAAAIYGVLTVIGVTFGLFYCLTLTCAARGLWIGAMAMLSRVRASEAPPDAVPAVVMAGATSAKKAPAVAP